MPGKVLETALSRLIQRKWSLLHFIVYAPNIIQCKDCSAVAYYCESCCVNIHETVLFHMPNIWKCLSSPDLKNMGMIKQLIREIFETRVGSYYVPFKNKNIVSLKRQGHDCVSAYNKELLWLTEDIGVQHKVLMEFCKCEKEAVTVIRYGMWPSSPDIPKVIFQRELVEMATVKDVYRVLVGDSANEYRYHRTIFGNGMHTVENLDFAKCPACSEARQMFVYMRVSGRVMLVSGQMFVYMLVSGRVILVSGRVDA
ncbi:hypothetical protein KUTeg_013861, partial [Tegillarca granosa]